MTEENQGFTHEELEAQAQEVEAIRRGKQIAVADIIKEIEALKLDAEQITNAKAQLNAEFKRLSEMEEKNAHTVNTNKIKRENNKMPLKKTVESMIDFEEAQSTIE